MLSMINEEIRNQIREAGIRYYYKVKTVFRRTKTQ
jgi:hypothetical protein